MRQLIKCRTRQLLIRFTRAIMCCAALLLVAKQKADGFQGRLVLDTVQSAALKGNLLGDSPARSVIVYLPPSYGSSANRYPAVYLLHGNGSHNTAWIEGRYQGFNMKTVMDSLIRKGIVREMLVVMPDAYNRYRGSHYANSPVTGNWSDFIARELVAHTDQTYRTIPSPASRGLAGYSMGARGALNIVMRYPGVFGAVYAMSSVMGFDTFSPVDSAQWLKVLALNDATTEDPEVIRIMSLASAFSPNPARPSTLVDFPYEIHNGRLGRVDKVWQRWLAHDPVHAADSLAHNLRELRAIQFDAGTSDVPIIDENRMFARMLTKLGIAHVFEEYEGDHRSRIGERITTRVLPFFNRALIWK